ncbi:MAG: SusC/RagA family TonB-linked outer membrane protein [Tannerellaceae bacterium]|jgi:TonB-linked SusC/RagA family outer membrane protein|nr:SusC/RagA family TonB-linked outer membrane protein [Tannerellaceae bacterium]
MIKMKIAKKGTFRKTCLAVCACLCAFSLFAQQGSISVTGTVSDEKGEPLPGANVVVKGTTTGVVSDVRGKYTVTAPSRDATLIFSFVGFTSQEVKVDGRTQIDVTLIEGQALEEVVVTGMNITRESKSLGYAVSTISAKELTKVGTPNFATALYGKAAGVRIQQTQGGNVAAVSISVRGLSSINGNNQPLVIVNGVPIRNGGTGSGSEATYAEFGAEGRIRANGLIDINPEDIESLTILKGAAATALYGSEAANGVVMITSKKSKGTGVTVDFNATVNANLVAYVPKVQTEYGPSMFSFQYTDYARETGGFYERTYKDKAYKSLTYNVYQWGPKYDGSDVLYWDGTVRKYSPITSEPWESLFRTGFNQTYNIAINQGNDKMSNRFSYTYNDELPNALSGTYNKHNFNLVGNLKLLDNVSLDYTTTYVIQNIHNRAQASTSVYGSFSNGFGSFLDVPLIKKMYKTSLGYRNTYTGGDATLTPDEAFAFGENNTNGVRNLMWDMFEHNVDEVDNRIISSVSPSWKIVDWLTLRARLSTDMTSERQESREQTERPLSLYDPSGKYQATTRRYNIYYGDVMLMFDKQLNRDFHLNVNAGWQGRIENMLNTNSWTDGGLTAENWFHLAASRYTARTDVSTLEYLKTAYFASAGVDFKSYLYLDVTGRQEKSSTLKNGSNSYFYPSFSSSFIFTEAFKDHMPEWYDFGKIRASYGVVGNAPGVYSANVVFEQGAANGFVYNHVPTGLGNELIRPEKTYEYEFGVESKFFKNRLGFEVSYYNRDIKDLILNTPQPQSSGVQNMLMNVGGMNNRGVEISLYGTPVKTRDFSWTINTNVARNWNEVTALVEGVEFLQNAYWGGGNCILRSVVGRPMGDFYSYVPKTNEQGQKLVSPDGYYINSDDYEVVGNAMPLMIGGISNSFTYKDFFLDVMMDFRIGGKVFNEMYQYSTALGITPETLKYRSTETGGLSYYFPNNDGNANAVAATGNTGPNGEYVFHNGVIQEGVVQQADGSYLPNTQIVPVDYLTYYTYNWGTDSEQLSGAKSVFTNTYWKLRELAFGYQLPAKVAQKLHCRNISVSIFGRNLFYLYKGMKNWDAESNVGTSWLNQAIVSGSASPTRTFGCSVRLSF